jgi:hypothetical protein
MRPPLLLAEPCLSLRLRGVDLVLWQTKVGPRERWRPKHLPFDTFLVENNRGVASVQGLRWLGQEGATGARLDFDGNVFSTILPARSVNVVGRLGQYRLATDFPSRFSVPADRP